MRARILIGYDGSPEGEDALHLGHALGRALDAVPVIVTVVRHARHGTDEEEFRRAVDDFCRPLFSTARDRLGGLEIEEASVVHDSRAQAFYELADWHHPTLIVIGSTKRGPAGRVVLGSLGVSLLSGAPCGVAVAPRGYANRKELDRIGVAVDGGPESRRALSAAAIVADRTGKPLRLITVMEPPHYVLGGLLSDLGEDEYRAYKERQAEERLDDAAERLPSGLSFERILLHGEAAESLTEAGKDLDLLLVGSRGYGPAKGALLGSVSARLMASAPCPVLVLPRGAGSRPLGAVEMQAAGDSADPG